MQSIVCESLYLSLEGVDIVEAYFEYYFSVYY